MASSAGTMIDSLRRAAARTLTPIKFFHRRVVDLCQCRDRWFGQVGSWGNGAATERGSYCVQSGAQVMAKQRVLLRSGAGIVDPAGARRAGVSGARLLSGATTMPAPNGDEAGASEVP